MPSRIVLGSIFLVLLGDLCDSGPRHTIEAGQLRFRVWPHFGDLPDEILVLLGQCLMTSHVTREISQEYESLAPLHKIRHLGQMEFNTLHKIVHFCPTENLKDRLRLAAIMPNVLNPIIAGAGVAFGVALVLAVSNGISSLIFNTSVSEFVDSRLGGSA